MLIIGLVLLLLGVFLHVHLLVLLGIVGLIVGGVLVVASAAGHAVGGRHWW